MEGVLLAIQRHTRLLGCSGPGSNQQQQRAGFFLGDGAGIGKGRQIAAILKDSLCRTAVTAVATATAVTTAGVMNSTDNNSIPTFPNSSTSSGGSSHTKRHLWLSVSQELIHDAQRDLRDVDVHITIQDGHSLLRSDNRNGLGQQEKGIMFLTYSFLVSKSRLEQIIQWCAGTWLLPQQQQQQQQHHQKSASSNARTKIQYLEQSYSGCIIFDEAHKAKNIANNTKTAQLVLQLQRRLPKARIVYCSATGVSNVAHLAYAERLGLWGMVSSTDGSQTKTQTHHYHHCFANFAAFERSLASRGLASLELLALELKQQGSFLARTLSWDGTEFQSEHVALTKQQQYVYDKSVEWWKRCKTCMETALQYLTNLNHQSEDSKSPGSMLWRIFWSAHQRFFKEMAVCAKIEFLANDAMQVVSEGCYCVVIGLQSTGEAGMQSLLETYGKTSSFRLQDQHFPHLLSTLKASLISFVMNHFPTKPAPSIKKDSLESLPLPEPIDELVQMRQGLLDAIENLNLPPNPLDDLIDRLGGEEHVAEMTGRSGRMLRACSAREKSQKKDYFVFSKRFTIGSGAAAAAAASQDDSDRLNLVERRAFQDGKKSFAIISGRF